jgi:two-component system, OmpR family, response regulator
VTEPSKGLVLVVEDERPIADLVRMYLLRDGFGVHLEYDGPAGLAAARKLRPVACVLDIGLAGITGTEICQRLREAGDWTPVIFLTARDDEVDRILGLELGGDDYVTKPFSLAEIVARIHAILRRTASELPGDVLHFGDLVLDETRHEVFRGDASIPLTATEFSLLRYFMLNPRRVLSKSQILQNVWRYDFGGNSNVVETYVSYLRKKLDKAGPPLIRTVRQAGYMLEASER